MKRSLKKINTKGALAIALALVMAVSFLVPAGVSRTKNEVKAESSKTTIWICGDETAMSAQSEEYPDRYGWGYYLGDYIDTSKYEIKNLSKDTSMTAREVSQSYFPTVESEAKSGDILILAVGMYDYIHQQVEHKNPYDPSEYVSYMTDMVQRAKAKGLTVYLVKQIGEDDDKYKYPLPQNGFFGESIDQIAANEQVAVIDLFRPWLEMIAVDRFYYMTEYYSSNGLHTNSLGAKTVAKMVSEGLFPVAEVIDYGDDIYDFGTTPSAIYETVESGEAISNPHKGFVMTAHTPYMIEGYDYGIGGSLDNKAWDVVTIVSGSPKWCDLNPAEGEYKWDEIDDMLDACEAHGLTYGIRIMPYSSYHGEDYVPDWVYAKGAEKNYAQSRDNPSETVAFPKWDDPIYIEAHKKFVKALAEKYDGDPRVEFIDVRPFGDFGEWHNAFVENGDSYMPSLEIEKDMLDCYAEAFDDSLLALPSNARGEIYQYALSIGITKRDDGLISLGNSERSLIPTYEANMPVLGENYWPYEKMKNTTPGDEYSLVKWTEERFRETIELSHLSIYALDQDSYCSYTFYQEQKPVIEEMCNRLGYNYTVVSAERLNNKLAITVKNTGLAPSYFNIQLAAEITDANGNKIENFGEPVLIQSGTFHDGKQKTFVFDYSGTLPADATICLAMYDIDNELVAGKDPTVRFDNKNNLSNKKLKLVETWTNPEEPEEEEPGEEEPGKGEVLQEEPGEEEPGTGEVLQEEPGDLYTVTEDHTLTAQWEEEKAVEINSEQTEIPENEIDHTVQNDIDNRKGSAIEEIIESEPLADQSTDNQVEVTQNDVGSEVTQNNGTKSEVNQMSTEKSDIAQNSDTKAETTQNNKATAEVTQSNDTKTANTEVTTTVNNPDSSKSVTSQVPSTKDNTKPILWIIFMALSVFAFIRVMIFKRSYKETYWK